MWFTETPWPPIVVLCAVACGMLAAWQAQKRGVWLVGCLVSLVGCGGIYAVEKAIVTDAERVEMKVVKLAADFQKKNREAVLGVFSKQAPQWRETANRALEEVDIAGPLDIKDMSVELFNEKSQALSRFRANGTVTYKKGISAYQPSRWEVRWQKEGSDWKIVDVARLHPFRDEEKQIFEP